MRFSCRDGFFTEEFLAVFLRKTHISRGRFSGVETKTCSLLLTESAGLILCRRMVHDVRHNTYRGSAANKKPHELALVGLLESRRTPQGPGLPPLNRLGFITTCGFTQSARRKNPLWTRPAAHLCPGAFRH